MTRESDNSNKCEGDDEGTREYPVVEVLPARDGESENDDGPDHERRHRRIGEGSRAGLRLPTVREESPTPQLAASARGAVRRRAGRSSAADVPAFGSGR